MPYRSNLEPDPGWSNPFLGLNFGLLSNALWRLRLLLVQEAKFSAVSAQLWLWPCAGQEICCRAYQRPSTRGGGGWRPCAASIPTGPTSPRYGSVPTVPTYLRTSPTGTDQTVSGIARRYGTYVPMVRHKMAYLRGQYLKHIMIGDYGTDWTISRSGKISELKEWYRRNVDIGLDLFLSNISRYDDDDEKGIMIMKMTTTGWGWRRNLIGTLSFLVKSNCLNLAYKNINVDISEIYACKIGINFKGTYQYQMRYGRYCTFRIESNGSSRFFLFSIRINTIDIGISLSAINIMLNVSNPSMKAGGFSEGTYLPYLLWVDLVTVIAVMFNWGFSG